MLRTAFIRTRHLDSPVEAAVQKKEKVTTKICYNTDQAKRVNNVLEAVVRLVREYLKACGIGLLGVALLGGVASVPNLSAVSIPLAPGMLLAAIIFPPRRRI